MRCLPSLVLCPVSPFTLRFGATLSLQQLMGDLEAKSQQEVAAAPYKNHRDAPPLPNPPSPPNPPLPPLAAEPSAPPPSPSPSPPAAPDSERVESADSPTWTGNEKLSSFPIQHDEIISPDLVDMCRTTLWNARDTCVRRIKAGDPEHEHGSTFVITGDIDDMWIRDSAAQVHPYIRFTQKDAHMADMIEGLIERQAFYINYDPYANAYRIDTKYHFSPMQNQLGRHGYISTYDFELDSGCYFMRLMYTYWMTNPARAAKLLKESTSIKKAVVLMLDVWTAEQHHEEDAKGPFGLYRRAKVQPAAGQPWTGFKGLPRSGKGTETKYTGMIWSAFRPSDDEQQYGYLVPSNMFAVVALGYVAKLADSVWQDASLAARCRTLAKEVDDGIRQYATADHPTHGTIYAYEVDGKCFPMQPPRALSCLAVTRAMCRTRTAL